MTVRMPFGRHKGKALAAIPDDYLCWCLRNCANMGDTLRAEMEAELADRGHPGYQTVVRDRVARAARLQAGPPWNPEQVAQAALELVDGTPAALMFGQVAALLVDAEVTAAEPMDVNTRRDLDSLAGQLQIVRSCLINMGRTSKRLTARRAAAVGTGTMDTSNAA